MTIHYKLESQLEHFACMVDILGRSKGPQEALKFISIMPFEADAVIWKTLLSICKICQDIEVAELVASNVLRLDPDDSSVYILLSNVYAESGKWADVSRTRMEWLTCPGSRKPWHEQQINSEDNKLEAGTIPQVWCILWKNRNPIISRAKGLIRLQVSFVAHIGRDRHAQVCISASQGSRLIHKIRSLKLHIITCKQVFYP
jgi:hypothetical protein